MSESSEAKSLQSNDKKLMLIKNKFGEAYFYNLKKIGREEYIKLVDKYPEMPMPSPDTDTEFTTSIDAAIKLQSNKPAESDGFLPIADFETLADNACGEKLHIDLREAGCEIFKSKKSERWWLLKFPESELLKDRATKLLNIDAVSKGFDAENYNSNKYAIFKT